MRGLRSSRAALDPAALGPAPIGTPGPDVLAATAPGQTLRGLGGDDRLSSAFDASTLLGGAGRDQLSTEVIEAAPDGETVSTQVTQHGGADDDRLAVWAEESVRSGAATMTLRIDGGRGGDEITVDARLYAGLASAELDAWILGGAGDDRIWAAVIAGAGGIDGALRIRGGTGDDEIDAYCENRDPNGHTMGDARTRIYGEDGDDVIAAAVQVYAKGSATATNLLDGGAGDDEISASTLCQANNSSTDQVNRLCGRSGNDTLTASHNAQSSSPHMTNLLDGGPGQDLLRVFQETDSASQFIDWLRVDNRLAGGSGIDRLRVELDIRAVATTAIVNRLEGGAGADALLVSVTGAPGSGSSLIRNLLWGGCGSDRLEAVGGTETRLEGGSGSDVFVLDPEAAPPLTVTLGDFDGAADVLEFRGLTDLGAPGLVDDLDAITTSAYEVSGVLAAEIGTLRLRVAGAPAGVDSFADLVADPARQLVAGPDAIL